MTDTTRETDLGQVSEEGKAGAAGSAPLPAITPLIPLSAAAEAERRLQTLLETECRAHGLARLEVVELRDEVKRLQAELGRVAHAEGMREGWLMRRRVAGVPPKWSGRRAMLTVDLAEAAESAGLATVPTLRTLRATACSCWIRAGMPAAVADALLGHRARGMGQVGQVHYWGGADLAQMDQAWLG